MPSGHSKPKKTKPYPDFPLTLHKGSGQWCKKIRGKIWYFGRDADAAFAKYLDQRDDLQAGRQPRSDNPDGCSLAGLCNEFLTAKKNRLEAGELSGLTFQEYHRTCKSLISVFDRNRLVADIGPRDFEKYRVNLAKTRNPTSVGDAVRRARMVFKFAYDNELIDKPIRYGQSFQPPSKRTLRRVRQKQQQEHGHRMFAAAELREILKNCGTPLKAIVLLGINCGLGQADCASLPISCVNLETSWLNFPRPKTATDRRCPLWPVTVEALRDAADSRPLPKNADDENILFITSQGHRWMRATEKSRSDLIASRFGKLLTKLGMKRPGVNFYALRHTFETVVGETKDQVAVDSMMGHADQSMAAVYREQISDERLLAVTQHVKAWLGYDEVSPES